MSTSSGDIELATLLRSEDKEGDAQTEGPLSEEQGSHEECLQPQENESSSVLSSESSDNAPKEQDRRRCFLDLHLLPVKLYYFIFMLGAGCIFPFLTVYFRFVGLSASQNGIVQGIRPFVNCVATPLWGMVGDKLGKVRVIWIVSTFNFIAFTAILGLIGPSSVTKAIHQGCNCTSVEANFSISEVLDSFNLTLASLCEEVEENRIDAEVSKFLQLAIIVAIGEFLAAPTLALADHFAMQALGNERKGDYGKQRLWGAVGWGLGAVGGGYVADGETPCDVKYTMLFIIFISVSSLGIIAAFFVCPSKTLSSPVKDKEKNEKELLPFIQRFKAIFSNPNIIAFLIAIWTLAMFMILIDNFLFWFLQDLGANQTLLGLSLAFTCMGEVPVFFISGRVIARIGHSGVVYIVFLAYALRFISYSFLSNPWIVLAIELLHGVTFALLWAVSTLYARHIAPPGLEASSLSIVSAVYWGLGRGCGGILGGIAWERYGARTTFRGAAVMAVSGCILYWAFCQLRAAMKRGLISFSACRSLCKKSNKYIVHVDNGETS
ncbi:major facilitator superfamily domain-containing protein 6-like [Oscarella lobularis]|uniref:major facilitator superfamily domain-containing protein 6-like n=1 Tax=Oscarella lobularis TaxID=121494 RepID=UPI003314248D